MNFESDCNYAECILIFSDDIILQIASNSVGRNKSASLGIIPGIQVLSLTLYTFPTCIYVLNPRECENEEECDGTSIVENNNIKVTWQHKAIIWFV